MKRKPPVHFLHIGKTGGTALRTALTAEKDAGHYSIKLHDHGVTMRDIPQGEPFFFCLRDPLARFVSGFYSRFRQGRPRLNIPWSQSERRSFERFPTPNLLACALSSKDPTEQAAACEGMRRIAHVRRRYFHWYIDEVYFERRLPDVLFIGFQETLGLDFEKLKALLGLSGSLELPDGDVLAHKNPSEFACGLSPEAVRNLRNWYWDDLIFYEACRKLVAEKRILAQPAPCAPVAAKKAGSGPKNRLRDFLSRFSGVCRSGVQSD